MLEELHCSFMDEQTSTACTNPAEFSIWNLDDASQTPSCRTHIGDLLGPGENRVMPIGEQRPE